MTKIIRTRYIAFCNSRERDGLPPFDYNKLGEPKGFSIDYIRLLARKAGFQIEFVNERTWVELVRLFQGKKFDIIPAMYRSTDDLTGKRIGIQTDNTSIGVVQQITEVIRNELN